jgi:ubiquinone/menaquinone biosynthesis C-methylase UbiE
MRRKKSTQKAAVGLFSRAAPMYNSIGPRHFTYFARRLVEYVDVQPGSWVLDVATGTGEVLLAAAERSGENGRLVGIDLTAAMLERAAVAIREKRVSNAELRQMDAERLELPDEGFDFVLSAFAISSFPSSSRSRAFRECFRVLRPAGRIGLVDCSGWYFQHDTRWQWQEDVLRSFGALPTDSQAAGQPTDVSTALVSAGFTGVESTEDAFDLVLRDEEEWWRWSWSHGTRQLFEAVPQARLDELKKTLFRGLHGCRQDDGMIHGTMRATLVLAHKPQRRGFSTTGHGSGAEKTAGR